ncbi:MAG: hypothetical protein LCI03_20565 [Actinobacteria bacterium]|nr:hypothetical protein [Actinomycetota bacterium]
MDASLLEQLQEAVGSNLGGGSGSGRPGRERTPLDLGAFSLMEQIDDRVRAWLDELGARPGKAVSTGQALRSWFTLWCATPREVGDHDRRRHVLEGWVTSIRDKLDPPDRIEITAPCPVCGHEFVTTGLLPGENPADAERVRALNGFGREKAGESFALCAACDAVWSGGQRMRDLAVQIDIVARRQCDSRLAGVRCELSRHKRDRHEAVMPWTGVREIWRAADADQPEQEAEAR